MFTADRAFLAIRIAVGALLTLLFAATVVAANWAVGAFHPFDAAPGVVIPAGVWFAGLAFTLRDIIQRLVGKAMSLVAIAAGTAVSYELGVGKLALAAALAFAVSEIVDFLVFSALEPRSYLRALWVSGAVALVVDSYLFLKVAPPLFPGAHNLDFFLGQVVGKGIVTALAVLSLVVIGNVQQQRALRRYEASTQAKIDRVNRLFGGAMRG